MRPPANILKFPGRSAREVTPSVESSVLLSVDDLSIAGQAGPALVRGVTFSIPKGGTLGIVGESGSGKSLTCRAILGLLPDGLEVTSGAIRYGGLDLVTLPRRGWRALRGVHLSAVFQDPASYLNPSIPIGVQLAEALRSTLKLDRRTATERASKLLRRVGLDAESVYRKYPFELSGGMAQRALIAIAISANPQLLIADEATTALDSLVQAEVLSLLDDLRREQGLTLILVSHDLAVVSKVCDHVVVMRDGVIVEAGPTERVLRDPAHGYTRSLIQSHHRYSIEDGDFASAVAVRTEPDPAPVPTLLKVDNLCASYRRSTHPSSSILHGIDLYLDRGEILGLIGETGSGKTTILRAILGLVAPQTGTISFQGKLISGLSGTTLRALRQSSHIQYVYQDPLRSLDPDLSVGASIAEGLDIKGGLSQGERLARMAATLEAVGLDPALAERRPCDLSGGQRQRVVIARALILDPAILLLDEPVSALDAVSRTHVLDLMRSLANERGIAQIFISHDLGSIAGVADRVAVLHRGRIIETGPTHELLERPVHPYTRRLLASVLRLDGGPLAGQRRALPKI